MTRAAAIWGLMYRHLALYRRSWPRLLELMYWPVLQMCIWGFTASFLAGAPATPPRSRQARCSAACCCGRWRCAARWGWRSASSRSCGRATSAMSSSARSGRGRCWPRWWHILLRMLTGVLPAILVAYLLYTFNLFALGPLVVLFFANLMVMGWWVALGVCQPHPAARRRGGGAGLVRAVRADAVFGGVLPRLRPAGVRCSRRARAAVRACVRGHARGAADGVVRWDHLVWAAGR